MPEEESIDALEARFQELREAETRFADACDKRSLMRLMREGRKLAKQERRLLDYLNFSYSLTNTTDTAIDGDVSRDIAIELIALLEDEDKARAFGPNFHSEMYEYTRSWMLPYVYKKLADATGVLEGYNSPGMHACIADGMNVCRRLGSLKSIIYFREFAFEVYQAADDLDLALHFARETIALQGEGIGRKVASADDAARLLGLQGRIQEAVEQVLEGWEYCETFHNPYMAKLNFLPLLRETCAVAGRADLLAAFPEIRWPHQLSGDQSDGGEQGNYLVFPERGSACSMEATADESLAVEAACAGDFDRAVALIEPWLKLSLKNKAIHSLLRYRCRLAAIYHLAGRMDDVRALAKASEPLAKKANDWLALRTMKLLCDPDYPANPLASLSPADCGPFSPGATATVEMAGDEPVASDESEAVQSDEGEPQATPLAPFFHELYERLESGEEQAVGEVLDRLLQLDAAGVELPVDGEQAMHVLNYLVDPARAAAALAWGTRWTERFPGESGIVSMFAVLADTLFGLTESDGAPVIAQEEVQRLFRRALEMDAECGRSYARAGMHYLSRGEFGEAERCLARAFRLNRQSPAAASGLAEVYANTERPRDALAVLDMALREGCDEPGLAWQAAMHANLLGQYDVMLTYLDWYGERVPDQKWLNHYRGLALIELNRAEEALQAIEQESQSNPDSTYPVLVQRASALGQLERLDEFRTALAQVLEVPLKDVPNVSPAGLTRMLNRLWISAGILPDGDPLRDKFETLLVKSCLSPDAMFDRLRLKDKEQSSTREVMLYRIVLGQPLDDSWSGSGGCLAGEEVWKHYNVMWSVLAENEDQAKSEALAWQDRCDLAACEVIDVAVDQEKYLDFPGVVGQGPRGGFVEKSEGDA